MGLFKKIAKVAKKTTKPVRGAVKHRAKKTYGSIAKPIAKTTYKSVLRPMGKQIGRDAKSTYKGTAGKLVRPGGVTPRQAYKTAKRIVTAPFKIARTLRKQTQKTKRAKGTRPRRR